MSVLSVIHPEGMNGQVGVQRSFGQQESACLYICSTPIGNLQDVTLRLLDVLREADLILAEDTRQSRKLLTHFEIQDKQLVSYHQHNEMERSSALISYWQQGMKIALLSDAGTPAVSDPGFHAVQLAIEHHVPVIPIPGASAVLAALVASGLSPQPFAFYGFPPRGASTLDAFLRDVSALPLTVVLYESPHRLEQTVRRLADICPNRGLVIARELTKRFETFIRGDVTSVLQTLSEDGVKGECVLLLAPAELEERSETDKLSEAVEMALQLMKGGHSHKQAVARAAELTGARKRDVYQLTLERSEP